MPIDPVSMDALLAKLAAAREAVTRMPSLPGAAAAGRSGDFATALRESLAQVDGAQVQANTLAERFQAGDPRVSLEETMISLSKANISFQQMVQVRNRVIAAYHDIMNMQV